LESAIFTGLIATGITLMLRAIARLAGAQKLLSEKPLGCNLCMAFWSSIPATLLQVGWETKHGLTFLAAYGLSYTLLELAYRPEPPALLDLEDK
jgi:hypothetical protein